MAWYRSLLAKFRDLGHGSSFEHDLDEEIRVHLALLTQRYVQQGLSPEEASSAAHRQFGNGTLLREARRDISSFTALETLWQDVRYGARGLRRSPGVTAGVILTLMLGIGANTALFSVIYAALFKPLPFPDPERLLFMTEKWTAGNDTMSAADLGYWRDHAQSFEAVAGILPRDVDLMVNGDVVSSRVVAFTG